MRWSTLRDRILTGLGVVTAGAIVALSFSGSTTMEDRAQAGALASAAQSTVLEEERLD